MKKMQMSCTSALVMFAGYIDSLHSKFQGSRLSLKLRWFVYSKSYLVRNPKCRFSCDRAQL